MSDLLPAGTRMAGVTIEGMLGRGGFGVTYLARDNRNGRTFALKEYFPADVAFRKGATVSPRQEHAASFRIGREAFYREATTLRTLPRQRSLVRVRGAFERSGTVYCLMDFVDGVPLDRMLESYRRRRRPVPEALVVQFVRSLAAALSTVHAAGLIHGDIKPANIMIRREDGLPVLIDFGAARHVERAHDGAAFFTREYAPIEHFPLDPDWPGPRLREGPWSDIFSVSVLLYRMLAQRLPTDARERLLGLRGQGREGYLPSAEAVAVGGLGGGYARRLTDLVDLGARLFPVDRPADAASFAELLETSTPRDPARLHTHAYFGAAEPVADLGGLTSAVQPPGGPARSEGGAQARPPRSRALVLAILILLAALLAVILAVVDLPLGSGPA